MLWNKRKPTDPARVAASAPDRSGYRVAEPDRALSAIGTLLASFGRFAFEPVSDPFNYDRIVRDKPMPVRDQIERAFRFANARIAHQKHADSVHFK